ncbi:MAG TPA: type IV toxin-antitoxin system AbiEi family antitoxin domain-containing protein [Solirubrobacteraceae bacterium]|nr:type IV toxin-antitoxin system AbiEi family antitoxin domain-containing protein [Solirubrobacteraceae bacterium]
MPDIQALQSEAYHQAGYFTAAQARAHRVSPQLLDHYVRTGRFERRRRGLYRITGFPSGEHDEIREAWLAVGPDKAVVSHDSALALHALSDHIPDAVHLLVPRRHRGVRRPPGVVLHTSTREEPIPTGWRDGIAVTAPARSIVDAANDLQPDQLVMTIRQALARGLLTCRQLEEEADRQRRRPIIDRALAEGER